MEAEVKETGLRDLTRKSVESDEWINMDKGMITDYKEGAFSL